MNFKQFLIAENLYDVIGGLTQLGQLVQSGNFSYPMWTQTYGELHRDVESAIRFGHLDKQHPLPKMIWDISSEYETYGKVTPRMQQLLQQAIQTAQQMQDETPQDTSWMPSDDDD